jgi:hypothetical protein
MITSKRIEGARLVTDTETGRSVMVEDDGDPLIDGLRWGSNDLRLQLRRAHAALEQRLWALLETSDEDL